MIIACHCLVPGLDAPSVVLKGTIASSSFTRCTMNSLESRYDVWPDVPGETVAGAKRGIRGLSEKQRAGSASRANPRKVPATSFTPVAVSLS